MIEFLREMLIEPFEDGEYLIGIISWIIFILLVGLLSVLLLWLVDSSFMPIKEGQGIIIGKYIDPAHYYTTYTQCGKTSIPITHYVPESYHINVKINSLQDDVSITQGYYSNGANIGDTLQCKYTNGRIMESLYIKEIN